MGFRGLGFRVEGLGFRVTPTRYPLGIFVFSLIRFNRIIFRNMFQRGFRAILAWSGHWGEAFCPKTLMHRKRVPDA